MAKLYDYTPENATMLAGTQTQFSTDGGQTFKSIQGIQSMVEIGNEASTIDQTTIEDSSKRYIAGIKDGSDQSLEFMNYSGDANQQELKAAADNGTIVTFQHLFPSGDLATYEATLLGWKMSSGGVEDLMKFTVSMKLNGDVTWSTQE